MEGSGTRYGSGATRLRGGDDRQLGAHRSRIGLKPMAQDEAGDYADHEQHAEHRSCGKQDATVRMPRQGMAGRNGGRRGEIHSRSSGGTSTTAWLRRSRCHDRHEEARGDRANASPPTPTRPTARLLAASPIRTHRQHARIIASAS